MPDLPWFDPLEMKTRAKLRENRAYFGSAQKLAPRYPQFMATSTPLTEVRADIWLWAARMFKTRPLAKQAIEGGKLEVNGAACKPSRSIRVGDRLVVMRGEDRLELEVLGLSDVRGPAPIAQQLYAESPASIAAREARREAYRHEGQQTGGRPDKHGRRQIIEFLDVDGTPIVASE